jgi:uncharacterized membrane protein YciS (DUF1049 family)
MGNWIVTHQTDFIIASILAIVCAIIFGVLIAIVFEMFEVGTRIRRRIREHKDKVAERSIEALRQRIKSQEEYKESVLLQIAGAQSFCCELFTFRYSAFHLEACGWLSGTLRYFMP